MNEGKWGGLDQFPRITLTCLLRCLVVWDICRHCRTFLRQPISVPLSDMSLKGTTYSPRSPSPCILLCTCTGRCPTSRDIRRRCSKARWCIETAFLDTQPACRCPTRNCMIQVTSNNYRLRSIWVANKATRSRRSTTNKAIRSGLSISLY